MTELVYLANARSVHVREWLCISTFKKPVSLYHIGRQVEANLVRGAYPKTVLPEYAICLPVGVQYALLGLHLRQLLPKDAVIHAHSASGYGLAAFLSGRRYIITTYGTEIFGAGERGFLYRKMLKTILLNASAITATSCQMAEELARIDPVLIERTHTFSLGVPEIFLQQRKHQRREAVRTWFVNRRIAPHYNTKDVVDAFIDFRKAGGNGRLLLLRGDADERYFGQILARIVDRSDIELIEEFLSRRQMRHYLDTVDFCISVPRSDQLSSAILEGLARGCIQILEPLSTYIKEGCPAIYLEGKAPLRDRLRTAFEIGEKMTHEELAKLRLQSENFISTGYTYANAAKRYCRVLNELGISSCGH